MIASNITLLSSLPMSQDGITGSVDFKIVPLRNDRKLTRETKVQLNNPRGVVNKVLYMEAPIRGSTASLLYTIFDRKGSKRAAAPPPPEPVEPDKSSLWMDLFSADSFILVIVCHLYIRGKVLKDISHDKC